MCQPYADKKNHQAQTNTEAGAPHCQIRPQRNKIAVTQRVIGQMTGVGGQMTGVGGQMTDAGKQMTEDRGYGIRKWECGSRNMEI